MCPISLSMEAISNLKKVGGRAGGGNYQCNMGWRGSSSLQQPILPVTEPYGVLGSVTNDLCDK